MGCCETPGLKPFEDALDGMLEQLDNVCSTGMVPTAEALGYGLAQNVLSPINVPPFNNSAMDGYAFRAKDLSQTNSLTLVGKSFAGNPFEGEIPAGGCIRIMTGAPLPADADTVEMQENTQADGQSIQFQTKPAAGNNVRRAAEDIRHGQEVLERGHKLTPRDIPLLASLGIHDIEVFNKLRVAILSTGDELKPLGQPLMAGEIYDSNRYGIKAILTRLGVDILDLGIVPDDRDKLREAFIHADKNADVVITSGGVSVGEADYTKDILDELGEIGFWKLAIKPGKPFAFGKLPNSVFFGLPGNPVSAMVTLYQLAIPAISKMGGLNYKVPIRLSATLTDSIKKAPGRMDFQRGVYSVDENGQLQVSSTGAQGSGVFSSMSQSNCFIIVERERGSVAAGETVTIEPYGESLL